MAISEAYTMSAVTISTTEISIVSGTSSLQSVASSGVYQLWLDLANLAKADEFTVRLYEKVLSGSTKRQAMSWTLLGVQSELFVSPPVTLINGWDWTILRTAGADRAISGSIRKIS